MIHNSESIPCIIGSTLGMFGALSFAVVYISFKAIRNFPRKLMFTLSIYDFLSSFILFLPGPISSGLCKVQGYLIAYTFPTPSYWCLIVAIIFILKIYGWKYTELEKFFIGAHIVMHIIEILITSLFIGYATPRIGHTHWCWIKEIWLEAIIYSFYWAFLIGCLVFYSILIWKARKIKGQSDFEKGFQIKMFFIPILYVFTAIWTSWKRLREMIDPSVPNNEFLDFTQGLFLPTQGFWDFVLFVVFDKEIRQEIKKKWFKCCSKKKTDDKDEKDKKTGNDLESPDISSDEKKEQEKEQERKNAQYYPTLPNQEVEIEMKSIEEESSSTEEIVSNSGVDVKSIEQDDL
ncbi:g protein-coupled receptor [Anaeramoeba ignava]|uniref:G protein-coupled receptor n=1 Tax=Anaeramoeba ignava TaxID=1746090 RepID=A0A9Q0LDL8_ANAIG|nr:g protein-coupled receptor [Anaeramoeba ignava]